jgi:hypothetical protein
MPHVAQSLDMNGYDSDSGGNSVPSMTPDAQVTGAEPAVELSPAAQRFQTCRWRKIAENGVPEHCTHRDVQPMAGTAGFTADSWCADCGHFKVRRNPRKRPATAPEDRYYY